MDKEAIGKLVDEIAALCSKRSPVRLMEVCGTHTVSLFRSGVKSMLPEGLRLISGPGCPVCVTAQGYIDSACELASRPDTTVCTYGDMVRVPGKNGSLAERRARGGSVVVVYSARDALQYAREHPDREIVFLAVGFETTAPGTAAVVLEAAAGNVLNFRVLSGHKLVVPAMLALLSSGEIPIDGFICPGHVSVVIGAREYEPIVRMFRKPCVVTGFEPGQMLEGIARLAAQVVRGEASVGNVYNVAVREEGNGIAKRLMARVFTVETAVWRAIGRIEGSGLALRDGYRDYDASARYGLNVDEDYSSPGCICGDVIQGKAEPAACSLFGSVCSPTRPVGPCMVSSEGTCAAWYKYGQNNIRQSRSPERE